MKYSKNHPSKIRSHRHLNSDWHSDMLGAVSVVVLDDLVPVDDIPPGVYVVRTSVLVLQVVGVLPNVQAQDWHHVDVGDAAHQWVI